MTQNLWTLLCSAHPQIPRFKQACNLEDVQLHQEYITQFQPDNFSLSMGLEHAVAADQAGLVHFLLEQNRMYSLGQGCVYSHLKSGSFCLRMGLRLTLMIQGRGHHYCESESLVSIAG